MASDEDETSSDSFYERYRQSDFLYSRNNQYKIVDLNFFEKQHVEKYLLIDLLKPDFRKVIVCDNFKIYVKIFLLVCSVFIIQ